MQQMPMQTPGNKPSVAVITSKYYEKLAVDAMMTDKTTFVKYKTEGKCNYASATCGWRHYVYGLSISTSLCLCVRLGTNT